MGAKEWMLSKHYPDREKSEDEKQILIGKITKSLLAQGDQKQKNTLIFTNIIQFLIIVVLLSAYIYQTNKTIMVPFAFVKDAAGKVETLGVVREYKPNTDEIKFFIEQFVDDIRCIPKDEVITGRNWARASAMMSTATRNKLNETFKKENVRVRQRDLGETAQIQLISNVQESDNSFQLRWTEEVFLRDGNLKERYNMVGKFTIKTHAVRTEELGRKNPLGIVFEYVAIEREI